MNKSELISKLVDRNPQLVTRDAEIAVTAILEMFTMTLVKDPLKESD